MITAITITTAVTNARGKKSDLMPIFIYQCRSSLVDIVDVDDSSSIAPRSVSVL